MDTNIKKKKLVWLDRTMSRPDSNAPDGVAALRAATHASLALLIYYTYPPKHSLNASGLPTANTLNDHQKKSGKRSKPSNLYHVSYGT